MSEVLVIGHRNPDTDAICSAIGYAYFKRQTGLPEAVAARCGDTNERTDFVLREFKTPAPRFVTDVSPKVRDVMQRDVISVRPGSTVAEALGIMETKGIRVMPVISDDGQCRGLLSLFKMSKFFFPAPHRPFDSRQVRASIANLARTLGAEVLTSRDADVDEELILMVGAMSVESFSERLTSYPAERLLVVVGDRREIQASAIEQRVRVIIVTGGLPVDKAIVEEAEKRGTSLLVSPQDSATTVMLSRAAVRVDSMTHERFLSFREDEPLSAVRALATPSSFQAFPVVNQNKEMAGILSKSDFLKEVDRKLILVDHNELSQAVHGAGEVTILEVVDHHRLGLNTAQPIYFHNEPVGSTSTIVADCFIKNNVAIPEDIAGLLLAGIVSDTLNLTSPTTQQKDVDILGILENISQVNAARLTERLFASGSVLVSRSARQAIESDCKEYQEDGSLFSVAQIEELGFDQFWGRKTQVVKALEEYRQEHRYLFSALLVTDVAHKTSLLVMAGDERVKSGITYPEVEPGVFDLNDIVSRKKQLLPYLTHCLGQVG